MKRITEGLIIILILTIIPVSMFGQKYTAVDKWLVLGSFSDNERSNLHKTAFINESMASPAPGDKAGDLSWQVINRHSLDFTSAGFKEITNAVAYALTYIYSKENQLATLYLGSDDGSMVWVNGYPVWDKIGADRALRENEDVIALQLFRGYNRVLVKVEQGGGGWGLICNLDTPVPVTIGTDHPSENEMARALDVQIIHTDLVLHDRVADFRVTAKIIGWFERPGEYLACGSEKDIASRRKQCYRVILLFASNGCRDVIRSRHHNYAHSSRS
jgi:hypothetical protein